jgi:sulfite reductase (NADPH) hemoprotein beta-component
LAALDETHSSGGRAPGDATFGPARFDFADERDVDTFVETLSRFERGELSSDQWRAFRLVNGTYGQRQEGTLSMVRVKLPQGIVSADQVEALAEVASRHGRGFVHVTTRQNVQLHFIPLDEVGTILARLAESGLTTREACGNAIRNVTTSPTAGVAADEVFDPVPYAEAITRHFLRHPLAAKLPRKFKIAVNGGGDDHSYAPVNDLGYHARLDGEGKRGFRLTVAGGTAILCRSGHELAPFVPANDILAYAEAVLRVFDRAGDRVHRQKNRLKFLVRNLGWEVFRERVEAELAAVRAGGAPTLPFDPESPPARNVAPTSRAAAPEGATLLALLGNDVPRGPGFLPRALPVLGDERGDRFRRTNVRPQRQAGYSMVSIVLPLGDVTAGRLRAIAALSRAYADGAVRFTPSQNVLLHWVKDEEVGALHEHLRALSLAEPDVDSVADVGSCPGAETCKLAVTQSRGAAQLLGDAFRADRGFVDRASGLHIRISGCPNGCGLHHVAPIGFQGGMRKIAGRAAPFYTVYAGAAVGDDAAFGRIVGKVPARRVVDAVRALVASYEEHRKEGERADEYLARASTAELRARLAPIEAIDDGTATPEDFVDIGDQEAFRGETSEGECAS